MFFAFIAALWATAPEPVRWDELTLSIYPDPYTSSDSVTLCRVRVVNHGQTSWSGRRIRFEARALAGGRVVERQRGRFGLTLAPRDSLETIIGFSGSYRSFEVSPVEGPDRPDGGRARRGGGGKKRRKR